MDVLFAVLPFAEPTRPVIGVSLLKAAISLKGFTSEICYFNLAFAETIGLDGYTRLAEVLPPESLVGEWFFADCVFGERVPPARDYVATVLPQYPIPNWFVPEIMRFRGAREAFLNRCVSEICRREPRVVGFTTAFHQTCACLAVASRLKQLPNPPIIIFGGANCEGEMGRQLVRSFPSIDYVCIGEGDIVFPLFLERVLRDGKPEAIPGIVRRGEDAMPGGPPLVRDLDELPIPDYADYFAQLAGSSLSATMAPELPIETSRGCWWGAVNHCTFCGLNGETMAYRSKSPERVLLELRVLVESYEVDRVSSVDNILDLKYIRTVFPRIGSLGRRPKLFFETKANLRFDQLATLRNGGVDILLPGIESFGNEILRLMRKGCTGLQNLQFLRWCEELGIHPLWNLLFGFPGEPQSEYDEMAELVPKITHLVPPSACGPFRLDRFSPLFTRSRELGLTQVRPSHAYYYVFPLGRSDLEKLAYHFDFDYADGRNPWSYTSSVNKEMIRWARAHAQPPERRPRLDLHQSAGAVVLQDTRECAVAPVHRLDGLAAEVYLLCDQAQGLSTLVEKVGGGANESLIRKTLLDLQQVRLMVEMDGKYLSLAVIRDRAPRLEPEEWKVSDVLQEATTAHALPDPI
jgi:ribosomal peptide maturation radical SAM protein 1